MKPALLSIAIIFLVACHHDHGQSSKDKYRQLEHQVQNKPKTKALSSDQYVAWPSTADRKFLVKKVWAKDKRSECKSCHDGFALKLKAAGQARAHWDIQLNHQSMTCATCHNSNKVYTFAVGPNTISANHNPTLCANCHSDQVKDWQLGAHGKRASGWQSERAVYACTSCHNPHSPNIKKRWPSVVPQRPPLN